MVRLLHLILAALLAGTITEAAASGIGGAQVGGMPSRLTGDLKFPNGKGIQSDAGAKMYTGSGGGTWWFKPSSDAAYALGVIGYSATQTGDLLMVVKGDGQVAFRVRADGKVRNDIPCDESGFERAGPNLCINMYAAADAWLSPGVCTAIPAPAGASYVLVRGVIYKQQQGAGGVWISSYTDTGCGVKNGNVVAYGHSTGTGTSYDDSEEGLLIAKVIGGNIYLKFNTNGFVGWDAYVRKVAYWE